MLISQYFAKTCRSGQFELKHPVYKKRTISISINSLIEKSLFTTKDFFYAL